jgi:hypothetical protein
VNGLTDPCKEKKTNVVTDDFAVVFVGAVEADGGLDGVAAVVLLDHLQKMKETLENTN